LILLIYDYLVRLCNQGVAGSNPAAGTNEINILGDFDGLSFLPGRHRVATVARLLRVPVNRSRASAYVTTAEVTSLRGTASHFGVSRSLLGAIDVYASALGINSAVQALARKAASDPMQTFRAALNKAD
jgi:hypothetical protein